jgi:hypothetical protein
MVRLIYGLLILALLTGNTTYGQVSPSSDMTAARQSLAEKRFGVARIRFAAIVRVHPDSVEGMLGLADAELGIHAYEAAELDYRKVVAAQPELWIAHKNLVIVEAALGRWDEFDRERALLRDARDRGAPGISRNDTDVIDSFVAHKQRWIVREYAEPAGRSLERYNFESFGPNGRVQEYISLESAEDAKRATPVGGVQIGQDPKLTPPVKSYGLNWYTGKSHGAVALYPNGEPTYEKVREDVLHFLQK